MILKEAFRMQNKLTDLMNSVSSYFYKESNISKTVETHMRAKSNPNAVDEEIIAPKDDDYDANDMLDFLMDIIKEKEKLANKISEAKLQYGKDIDMQLSINKWKQNALATLKRLASFKPSETTVGQRDYMINGEGNQVPYYYNVKKVTTIDFDRTKVKGIMKSLQDSTDDVSNEIDLANVTIEVDYVPKYDIADDFDECFMKYLGMN